MRISTTKGPIFFLISFLILVLITKALFVSRDTSLSTAPATAPVRSLGTIRTFSRSLSDTVGEEKIPSNCDTVVACILCEDTTMAAADEPEPVSGARVRANQIVARDFRRQIDQVVVLLKSIVISSKYSPNAPKSSAAADTGSCTKVILVSDTREHFDSVMDVIYDDEAWSPDFLRHLRFVYWPVTYPPGTSWMKTMFRPCATLRLFLPDILPRSYKALIYLDTDIIFLRDIRELWKEFEEFTDETIAAMSPCLFHYGTRANKIPYYGISGLNAGIMLMNLTRMRETLWTKKIRVVTQMYERDIKLADQVRRNQRLRGLSAQFRFVLTLTCAWYGYLQDILNIYFHFFPEHLHEFSCVWNFRPWNCRRGSACEDVTNLSAMHGNALSFTSEGSEPWFYTIFQQYKQLQLNDEFSVSNHMRSIEKMLNEHKSSNCFRYPGLTQALFNRLQNLNNI